MQFGNVSAVPLSVAVFLATDNYDYSSDPHTITATALIKPVRQIVLSSRVKPEEAIVDLSAMIPLRFGTALHDAVESSWKNNYARALAKLGYPEQVIRRIRINPSKEELTDDCIPVYLEQRAYKQVGHHIVSGKFDFVGEGRLEDFKTTSTYVAMNNSNDEKYRLQGSIYRWLSPEIITEEEMLIQYLFTDWSKAKALQDPRYPQSRIQQLRLPLIPLAQTDRWVKQKLDEIDTYRNAPEEELPLCSDEDLWRGEPVFKYYRNPAKQLRSTKNFETKQEAFDRLAREGVGMIKEVPGQVSACRYCQAFNLCSQKDALIAAGDLII